MMRKARHPLSPRSWVCHACAGIAIITAARASADIIQTIQDEEIVGRVTQGADGMLTVISGDASGRKERRLAPSEVKQRWQAADELERIEATKEVARLARWTAAYYRAGYETLAKRCMRRAMTLDKAFADAPVTTRTDPALFGGARPGKDFSRFWNLVILDEMDDRLAPGDIGELLKIAAWANRAGLKQEAAYYLRKAWSDDRSAPEIVDLAAKWGVKLEGWLSIDLTPAMDASLFSDFVRDEGTNVQPDPGRVFFNLPVRFDPDLAGEKRRENPSLTRNTLKRKDAREFYGLRSLTMRDGRVRIDGHEVQPVVERITLLPGEGARRMAELRNQLGPRSAEVRAQDDKQRPPRAARQTRLRGPPINERATGWVAFIFELPADAVEFKVAWPEGGEETLDLGFIRTAALISPDEIKRSVSGAIKGGEPPGWPWSSASAIVSTLATIQSSSPAMAALAIERLRRIRIELGWRIGPETQADLDAWSEAVDESVLRSAMRSEEQVRLAAFRYFCDYPPQYEAPVSTHAMELLARAEPDLQFAWVRMIDCGLRRDPCTYWWRQGAPTRTRADAEADSSGAKDHGSGGFPPAPLKSSAPSTDVAPVQRRTARLLEALLQSEDAIVCSEALDILLSLPESATDWKFMRLASAPAQGYALSRIRDIRSESSVSQLLQALMLSARPEIAQDVAREARILGLRAKDTDASILTQWADLDSDERRAAFLKVLSGVALGELVYSKRFSRMVDEALHSEESVREAAWRFLLAQLRLRRENTAAEAFAPPSRGSPGRGPFPVMIDPASHDALLDGVLDAARRGTSPVRLDALRALLELGYADEAARCIIDATGDSQASDLSSAADASATCPDPMLLIDDPTVNRSDAMLAFLGRFLAPGAEKHAPAIIAYLNTLAAETPPSEHWRIRAALKCGVNIDDLDALGKALPPPASLGVERWLSKLCHMTDQDRQRLTTAATRAERADRLAQINLRRGRLVDGLYGGLVVLAVTSRAERSPDAAAGGPTQWNLSRRVTLPLPPIELRATEKDDGQVYVICQGCIVGRAFTLAGSDGEPVPDDNVVGSGRVMEQVLPIRSPRAYFPVLTASPAWWDVAGVKPFDGGAPPSPEGEVIGPLRLPNHKVLKAPTPGTITLDAAPLLRDAIRKAGLLPNEDLEELVPSPFLVTLRYRLFGLFSGCGTDVLPGYYPPDDKNLSRVKTYAGQWHIMNMMLVMEKLD